MGIFCDIAMATNKKISTHTCTHTHTRTNTHMDNDQRWCWFSRLSCCMITLQTATAPDKRCPCSSSPHGTKTQSRVANKIYSSCSPRSHTRERIEWKSPECFWQGQTDFKPSTLLRQNYMSFIMEGDTNMGVFLESWDWCFFFLLPSVLLLPGYSHRAFTKSCLVCLPCLQRICPKVPVFQKNSSKSSRITFFFAHTVGTLSSAQCNSQ